MDTSKEFHSGIKSMYGDAMSVAENIVSVPSGAYSSAEIEH
jgi:hypothetical protein